MKDLHTNYLIRDLLPIVNGQCHGDVDYIVNKVSSIDVATTDCVTFCNPSSKALLAKTKAGVILTTAEQADLCPNQVIIVQNPRLAFAKLLTFLFNKSESLIANKIAQSAQIANNVKLSHGITIDENVVVASGCFIGDNVSIGANTKIDANVVIYSDSIIGENCVLHAGAVIGKPGFGYEMDENHEWFKVPQVGRAILENNVEIGANSCIDKGALADTVIKRGVKCDNHVQIGHNTVIGEHSLICGCVGISGSVTVGKYCILAGGSMVGDHVSITDNCMIAGACAVRKNIDVAGKYAGDPAKPLNDWLKDCVNIMNLTKWIKLLKRLEKGNE